MKVALVCLVAVAAVCGETIPRPNVQAIVDKVRPMGYLLLAPR